MLSHNCQNYQWQLSPWARIRLTMEILGLSAKAKQDHPKVNGPAEEGWFKARFGSGKRGLDHKEEVFCRTVRRDFELGATGDPGGRVGTFLSRE